MCIRDRTNIDDVVVNTLAGSRPLDSRKSPTIRIHIAHCDDSFDLPTIVVSCCALLDPSVPVRKTRQNNIRQNTFVDIFAHSHEFVLRWSSSLMNVPGSCLSDTLIGWRWCFMTLRLSYRVEFLYASNISFHAALRFGTSLLSGLCRRRELSPAAPVLKETDQFVVAM